MKSFKHKKNNFKNNSSISHRSLNEPSIHDDDEEVDLYQPSALQRNSFRTKKPSSFKNDLVNFLQLAVVLILIAFIFVIGYFTFLQASQLYSEGSKDILEKHEETKPLETVQMKQKLPVVQEKKSEEIDKQIRTENEEMESAMKEDLNEETKHNNLQKFKQDLNSEKSKQTQVPQNSESPQVYDPVLIQLNKFRDKLGSRYKESIYIIKNTSITTEQYERAKGLIEISQFYNPKEKSFKVKQNMKDGNCGSSDMDCISQQEILDSKIREEVSYYEHKYQDEFKNLKKELPFCLVVPSYKNNHYNNIVRNLNSIFQQQYQNFHVVYIDDASKDGTPEAIKNYSEKYSINESKLLFIENQQNQKALKNIYTAAHEHCKEKEIMIIVDGDDYLIGTQVLRFLNYQYQTKKLLASYTNYLRINEPFYIKVGTSTPYPNYIKAHRSFRKNPTMFRASHLRSYYVDLFRKIKAQDLKDENGEFFTAANDFAIMMPILEMASPHIQYLPELTYLYDSGTGLNNFQSKKQAQARNVKIVSNRKIYEQIVSLNHFYPEK